LKGSLPEQVYVEALLKDLRTETPHFSGRDLKSIFIGGGTPSLFSAEAIAKLLQGVAQQVDFTDSIEITLEANPGAVEANAFAGYRQAGVNRLSLGVQSLNAQSLQDLGRIHTPQEAIDAVCQARRAGFENINLDLMFGLPEQTAEMARQDLATAIELNPEHLSYYQLTLEPNTVFYYQPPVLPEEESLWEMQCQGEKMLLQAGFEHYEISAFAQHGYECRHNLNYWRFGDYLGIGAGAHGKVTLPGGHVVRRWKQRHPAEYIASVESLSFIQGERRLDREDLILEFMMNGLRLGDGVEAALLEATTGIHLKEIETSLTLAVDKGLLLPVQQRLCPTPLGQRFLNDLLGVFQVKKNS
jgi:oxygen-independent coproporphyrinogen-3 oxidase